MSSELTEEYLKEEYSDEGWWVEQGYANPEDVPSPDWHLAILKEREARDGVHFPNGKPWEELYEELMQEISEEIKRRKK